MSLHPIKSRQKPKPGKGYARLRVEHGWETGEKKPWSPGKWTKRGILSLAVLSIILASSFSYYQGMVAPNLPGSSNYHQPDPFNVIWDGQVPTTFTSAPGLFSSVSATCNSSPCNTATTVKANSEIIILGQEEAGGISCPDAGLSFSDSFSNSFSSIRCVLLSTGTTTGAVYLYAASTSSGGSDTVSTSNCQNIGRNCAFLILDYVGFSGFGASSSFTSASASGSDTRTITVNSGSIILGIASVHNDGVSCGTETAGSNQLILGNIACQTLSGQGSSNSLATSSATEPSGSYSDIVSWATSTEFGRFVQELKGNFVTTCSGVGYSCSLASISAGQVLLNPNATFPGVVLSSGAVDLSTGASKALAFTMTGIVPSTITTGEEVAWYLTANQTLPIQAGYNPINDTAVALILFGVKQSAATMNYYVYLERQPGQVLTTGSDDPGAANCNYASTEFRCSGGVAFNTAGGSNNFHLVLNFTGGTGTGPAQTAGQSYLCAGSVASGPDTCQVGGVGKIADQSGGAISFPGYLFNQTLFPWLNIQNNYHVGMWEKAGGAQFEWITATNANGAIISVFTPPASTGTTTEGGFFGWVGRALGGAWNAVSGFIAPIAGPVIGLGNSLLSVFISGLIQAGNLLIQGLTVLESVLVTVLNTMGSFLRFGNIGTNIQTLINSLVTFFTNGTFTNSFAFLGSGFTFLFNSGTIVVSWFNVAITFVTGGIAWASAGIGFVGTAAYWFFLGWSTLYGTIFIILWFIDLGDYGAQGGLIWFDTMRWLFFGTGIGFLIRIINLGLDMITYLVGLIPKPIIQMVAHIIPRIPIIEASGSPTFPDGHMEAARNGNVFTVLGWMLGFFFTVAYEGTTLPGSIGAFVPGAAASTSLLTNTLPLFEIMLFMGGLTLVFILPAKMANFMPGLFEQSLPGKNIPVSLRAEAPARGPTHVGIRKAEKRFQGRLEKKLAEAGMRKRLEMQVKQDLVRREQERAKQGLEAQQRQQVERRLAKEAEQRLLLASRQARERMQAQTQRPA